MNLLFTLYAFVSNIERIKIDFPIFICLLNTNVINFGKIDMIHAFMNLLFRNWGSCCVLCFFNDAEKYIFIFILGCQLDSYYDITI